MKKILVALALAAFATSSFAAVENSKHDFDFWGTFGVGKVGRCMYCHTPHNAQTWASTALWATNQPDLSAYTFYSARRYKVTTVDVRGTQTCLACHGDTTISVSGLSRALTSSDAGYLGSNLQNDHPVGAEALWTPGTGFQPGPIRFGYGSYDTGGSYEMECATCHSPHNSYVYPGSKMVQYNRQVGTSADFCSTCHTT